MEEGREKENKEPGINEVKNQEGEDFAGEIIFMCYADWES